VKVSEAPQQNLAFRKLTKSRMGSQTVESGFDKTDIIWEAP
jgi:hypothetical protein